MTRAALRRPARLLSAAAVVAALGLAAPALARPTGHARVVRAGALAAVVHVQLTHPGEATPQEMTVTVLVGGDGGHVATRLKDGTRLSLRFGVHREGQGFSVFATTAVKGALKRLGPLAPGGTVTLPGPGKTTIALTLEKVTTVAALRRR